MSVQAHPYSVDDDTDYGTGSMGDKDGVRFGRPRAGQDRPASALFEPYRDLAPSPTTLVMLAIGLLGAALGAAAGTWLRTRRTTVSARPVKRAQAKTTAAVTLAPLALRLLSNPIVRQVAIRMLLRQLTRRLPV